jgi:hypothetical protein
MLTTESPYAFGTGYAITSWSILPTQLGLLAAKYPRLVTEFAGICSLRVEAVRQSEDVHPNAQHIFNQYVIWKQS